MNKKNNLANTIALNDIMTSEVLNATTLASFATALQKLEIQMSIILETQTIKESLFPDFNGVLKSLGAWGGDFILAIALEDPTAYFSSKGYSTVIPYKEMILGA